MFFHGLARTSSTNVKHYILYKVIKNTDTCIHIIIIALPLFSTTYAVTNSLLITFASRLDPDQA